MFLRYNFTGILWALTLLFLSLIPGRMMPDLSFWQPIRFDRVAHMVAYAILVFKLAMGFYKQYTFRSLRYHALQVAFIFSLIYGAMLELLQGLLLTDRHPEILDFMANAIGCLSGAGLFHALFKNIYFR